MNALAQLLSSPLYRLTQEELDLINDVLADQLGCSLHNQGTGRETWDWELRQYSPEDDGRYSERLRIPRTTAVSEAIREACRLQREAALQWAAAS